MKKPSILIVEDESAILHALTLIFTQEGFRVLVAHDGEEGLSAGLAHRPDLILFDINMPVMDGMAMFKAIRTAEGDWGKRVKAIVYSNLSYDQKIKEAQNLKVIEFLVKANTPLGAVVLKAKEALRGPVMSF